VAPAFIHFPYLSFTRTKPGERRGKEEAKKKGSHNKKEQKAIQRRRAITTSVAKSGSGRR
jgi:hypothetical protein